MDSGQDKKPDGPTICRTADGREWHDWSWVEAPDKPAYSKGGAGRKAHVGTPGGFGRINGKMRTFSIN